MTKAIVIRAGDPALAGAIAGGIESAEMKRLRAELGVRKNRDQEYWADKIAEARKKYQPRPVRWHEILLAWLVESFRAWRATR